MLCSGATEFWPGSHFDTLPATTNKPRDPAGQSEKKTIFLSF